MATDRITLPFRGMKGPLTCRPPGSKSLTNRALIAAALCEQEVELQGALASEDTHWAAQALQKLGVQIIQQDNSLLVSGTMNPVAGEEAQLYLGNAGTATRFLTAVLCAKGIPCRIDGDPRMRQRPIGDLLDALEQLGGSVISETANGCPPLRIHAQPLRGGTASLSGQISSQFFSGLMMAAPMAPQDTVLEVKDHWASKPYLVMTADILRDFNVHMEIESSHIRIPGRQCYLSPGNYTIEPDASAATYPLGLALLHGQAVTLDGLGSRSIQGDMAFIGRLEKMGCTVDWSDRQVHVKPPLELSALDDDLNDIPDAAMTLCVLCCVAKGTSHLRGLANLQFKECERLTALETELRKMGANITATADGFEIVGKALHELHGATIETYKDHRMAMCLSLLGTLLPQTEILDPGCTAKTYPQYWQDLEKWLGP